MWFPLVHRQEKVLLNVHIKLFYSFYCLSLGLPDAFDFLFKVSLSKFKFYMIGMNFAIHLYIVQVLNAKLEHLTSLQNHQNSGFVFWSLEVASG